MIGPFGTLSLTALTATMRENRRNECSGTSEYAVWCRNEYRVREHDG